MMLNRHRYCLNRESICQLYICLRRHCVCVLNNGGVNIINTLSTVLFLYNQLSPPFVLSPSFSFLHHLQHPSTFHFIPFHFILITEHINIQTTTRLASEAHLPPHRLLTELLFSHSNIGDPCTSKSLEVLMDRLQLVLYKAAPSKRILWTHEYGQDAQDTIHSEQKPNSMDVSGPSLRLPTPSLENSMSGEQMIQAELVEARHRSSDKSGIAQEQSSLTHGEEDSQFPLPSAKVAVHRLTDKSQKTVTSREATNRPDLDPSIKLATHNEPSQHSHGDIAYSAHPLKSLDNRLKFKRSSPVELNHCRDPTFRIPPDSKCMKDENRISVNFKAEAVSPKNKLNSQTAESATSIVDECLCGCGGDAKRCLRPNRPPSMVDDTFFDKSLDSHLAMLIKLRLEVAVRDLEPSRRIWWREEFGGCAPDRKPLDSEIRSARGDDVGNVLRTSLPLFNDVTTIRNKAQDHPSRKRQRSMSLPTTATHRQDGNGNLPQNYTYSLNNAPRSTPLYESSRKCKMSATEFGDSRPHEVRGRPLFREPIVAPKAKRLKSPTRYIPNRFPRAMYYPPGRTPPINLRKRFLRTPPPHPKIEEPTAEEREKSRQSAQLKFEAAGRKMRHVLAMNAKRISLPLEYQSSASECGNIHQAQRNIEAKKMARNTERFQQMKQLLNQNIESMKTRKDSRYGTALYRHDRWIPDDLPTPNVYDVGKVGWKTMDPRMRLTAQQSQGSMYQNLDAVKLRRTALTL